MRRFHLRRVVDETGISGTGIVTEGYIYDGSGICVMRWLTDTSSVAVYESIKDVEIIHGHQGKTLVEIDDVEVHPSDVPAWAFDPVGYFEDKLDGLY